MANPKTHAGLENLLSLCAARPHAAVLIGVVGMPAILQVAQRHKKCRGSQDRRASSSTQISFERNDIGRSVLHGHPPKFIWVRAENCSTKEIENLLRTAVAIIRQFMDQVQDSYLVLGPRRKPASIKAKK